MKKGLIVTIDGPAGTGKSTVARLLAKKLNFNYLDTGALYRVITYKAIKANIDSSNKESLKKLLKSIKVKFINSGKIQKVFLNGREVTELIRHPDITSKVFCYAELPIVRNALLKIQRHIGAKGNIVGEGRDLGSVVFPQAGVKIYLDASPEERAKRRWKELKGKGIKTNYNTVLKEIKSRDYRDRTRKIAPLKKAKDMMRVDTTKLSISQTVKKLYAIVKEMEKYA
jgi:cytidylate kinase